MKKIVKKAKSGLSNPLLLIISIVITAVLILAVWQVIKNNSTDSNNAQHAEHDECQSQNDDQDICHFINGWKDTKKYHVEINNTANGKTTTATFEADGDKSHILSAEGETVYEVITIGQNMYTKAADGTWWMQAIKSDDENPAANYDYEFEDPNDSSTGQKPTYESLGMENCGSMECYKYKVVDPKTPDDVSYLWFDVDEYMARRIRVESSDGSVSEQTFSYDNVQIAEPSPVKELGPNQYILPGQTEPVTLPTAP